jgi:hypothetical protein
LQQNFCFGGGDISVWYHAPFNDAGPSRNGWVAVSARRLDYLNPLGDSFVNGIIQRFGQRAGRVTNGYQPACTCRYKSFYGSFVRVGIRMDDVDPR